MKVPSSACPACKYVNDRATSLEDESLVPKAGDLSVCLNCGEIMIFNDDLTTRSVTLNDLAELPPEIHAHLDRMQRAVRGLSRTQKRD
jgi:hypothetical protein